MNIEQISKVVIQFCHQIQSEFGIQLLFKDTSIKQFDSNVDFNQCNVVICDQEEQIEDLLEQCTIVCYCNKLQTHYARYQQCIEDITCLSGNMKNDNINITRQIYHIDQLLQDYKILCENKQMILINKHNCESFASHITNETIYILVDNLGQFAHIQSFLRFLAELLISSNVKPEIILITTQTLYHEKQFNNIQHIELKTITNNLTDILNLKFNHVVKHNLFTNNLPCAAVFSLSDNKIQKQQQLYQPSIEKYEKLSNEIILQKSKLIIQENYYTKISSDYYIFGHQSNNQLVNYIANQLNKLQLISCCHIIHNIEQIMKTNMRIVLILFEIDKQIEINQILGKIDNVQHLFIITEKQDMDVITNFNQISKTQIQSNVLYVLARKEQEQQEQLEQNKSKHVDILSNHQFSTMFDIIFDYEATTQSSYQNYTIPRYKKDLLEQHKTFFRQFLDYLNVFFTFSQQQYDQLLVESHNKTDEEIYQWFKGFSSKMFNYRIEMRTKQLAKFLIQLGFEVNTNAEQLQNKLQNNRKQLPKRSLLDIGCSDGQLTYQTAQLLGVEYRNTYGLDIRNIIKNKNQINFIQCDLEFDDIPLPDNSISIVICTQVLHHINNFVDVIKNISRILSHGGYFIIRESFEESVLNQIMLDIQHGLYACVINNEMSVNDFVKQFKTFYLKKDEFIFLLQKYFDVKYVNYDGQNDKFQKCWIMCQKKFKKYSLKLNDNQYE